MEITLGYVIKTLVLPPGLNIFLALFGLLFRGRWPRAARLSLVLAFVLLWLAATPIVAAWLARGLESAARAATGPGTRWRTPR